MDFVLQDLIIREYVLRELYQLTGWNFENLQSMYLFYLWILHESKGAKIYWNLQVQTLLFLKNGFWKGKVDGKIAMFGVSMLAFRTYQNRKQNHRIPVWYIYLGPRVTELP